MKRAKITIIGSSNTDMMVKSERIPRPGETILGGTFIMNPGGKGANQAVAVARLGGQATFVAKVGGDIFGQQALEIYNKQGIDTSYLFVEPSAPSGVALIMVDAKAENSIAVALGANNLLTPSDIDKASKAIYNSDFVLMQLEIPQPTVEYAAAMAVKSGVRVVLNPAPARELSSELLSNLYMITPNRSEAEILSGIEVCDWQSAEQAAAIIAAKGVEIVVITLGSLGVLILHGEQRHRVAAIKVEAVDTTAAGDTFNGALCVAIAQGVSLVEAAEFACRAAAIAVTRMGAQSSIPYLEEVQ